MIGQILTQIIYPVISAMILAIVTRGLYLADAYIRQVLASNKSVAVISEAYSKFDIAKNVDGIVEAKVKEGIAYAEAMANKALKVDPNAPHSNEQMLSNASAYTIQQLAESGIEKGLDIIQARIETALHLAKQEAPAQV